MKKSGASQGQSTSKLISKRVAELGDWRGATLSRMRKLINEADPDVVEEWKWMGQPSRSSFAKRSPISVASYAGRSQVLSSAYDGRHAPTVGSTHTPGHVLSATMICHANGSTVPGDPPLHHQCLRKLQRPFADLKVTVAMFSAGDDLGASVTKWTAGDVGTRDARGCIRGRWTGPLHARVGHEPVCPVVAQRRLTTSSIGHDT